MLILFLPYTAMLLPLRPSGKPLDGLYTAKDLNLKSGDKRSLKSLYLYFKRLHLLKQAIT